MSNLYFRNETSPVTWKVTGVPIADFTWILWDDQALGPSTFAMNTVAGPVGDPPPMLQEQGGGTPGTYVWLSQPIHSVEITQDQTIFVGLLCCESNLLANATWDCRIYRVANDGEQISLVASPVSAPVEMDVCGGGGEVGSLTYNLTGGDITPTFFAPGDRIGVRIGLRDGNGVTMASGHTAYFRNQRHPIEDPGNSLLTFDPFITNPYPAQEPSGILRPW